MHNSTHTYAILKISQAAYDEIKTKLAAAGYSDQFHDKEKSGRTFPVIDMHGIAVSPIKEPADALPSSTPQLVPS